MYKKKQIGAEELRKLLTVTFVGFIAQLIDGSLGMAYGVTSSSLLLMLGMAPAVASASIHISEVVTTAASGFFHFKFGNVDRGTVMKLILPGGVGAFIGACFLSNMPGEAVRPFISVFCCYWEFISYSAFCFLIVLQMRIRESSYLTGKLQSLVY